MLVYRPNSQINSVLNIQFVPILSKYKNKKSQIIANKKLNTNLHEKSFTDAVVGIVDAVSVTPEPLPSQPAHGRCFCEAIFEAGC